jgi:murein DD-endopeptidase MepM/ murein hydrolase activator NlpD
VNELRLTLRRRHLAALAALVLVVLLGAAGIHSYELRRAEANLRALQALTAQQQAQLKTIDAQADELAGQLRAMQKENAQIRHLIGADRGAKNQHAMVAVPRASRAAQNFGSVRARLQRLARASAAASEDTRHLQRLALRVLNLRRIGSLVRERMLAEIPSIMPVNGSVVAGFGYRTDPWPEFHKGVDLAADYGSTVRAAAAGTVMSAGWDPGGFGILVDIDHGNGYHTWYAHLSGVSVAAGQRVTKGEPIAFVGSTGESTGPHLHYQLMKDGNPIDPQPFLSGVPAKVLATLPDAGHV